MLQRPRRYLLLRAACCCLAAALVLAAQQKTQSATRTGEDPQRAVTIPDAIRMTRLADRLYFVRGSVAEFSPDGSKFVIAVRNGNLEKNTNEYKLLLWRTGEAFSSPSPEVLLTMSSSSNRPGIKDVMWLNSESLVFLGESPGELQQIYSVALRGRRPKKLTNQPSNIDSFAISNDGRALAYVAPEPAAPMFDAKAEREGLVVTSQQLRDLVANQKGGDTWDSQSELFFQSASNRIKRIETKGKISAGGLDKPLLSPDGTHILVKTRVPSDEVPSGWSEYDDAFLQNFLAKARSSQRGQPSYFERYELIDTSTGRSRPLLDAPLGPHGAEAAWSSDGKSVVIAGTYLPLAAASSQEERQIRRHTHFTVEVQISGTSLNTVTTEDLRLSMWDWKTNCLVFANARQTFETKQSHTSFCKRLERWEKLAGEAPAVGRPEIVVEEGMNNPPRIFAVAPQSRQRKLLFDLNPQFKDLKFGKVEEIRWKGTDGREAKGGLYFPPNYAVGKRYPLVIQTHGFLSDKFWIDGPWTTAFAAQPLAGQDIVVLQADQSIADLDSPAEVSREVASLEGAIDALDAKGLIDRSRVGLIAHSRTCLYVAYMLTHSRYKIAAASISDGINGGYFQYVAFANSDLNATKSIETIDGAAPFSEGLAAWARRSPSFGLDKIKAPLRIIAGNSISMFSGWELFAALRRLGRAVELAGIKDGSHILEKPWDRMISQQGNVDWFLFWLKGEEDPDPAKAQQYARWRELRKLQEAQVSSKPN